MSHPAVYKSPQQRLSICSCPNCLCDVECHRNEKSKLYLCGWGQRNYPWHYYKTLGQWQIAFETNANRQRQQANSETGPCHVLPAAILKIIGAESGSLSGFSQQSVWKWDWRSSFSEHVWIKASRFRFRVERICDDLSSWSVFGRDRVENRHMYIL